MSFTASCLAASAPELAVSTPLTAVSDTTPRMKARWMLTQHIRPDGWDTYAMSDWELDRAGFADHHPHDEANVVLEGPLHIRVGDVELVDQPGDTIRVPAGQTGDYWAPKYARMLGTTGLIRRESPPKTLKYGTAAAFVDSRS